MMTRACVGVLWVAGLVLAGPANALIIKTSTLENAYIEALPGESLDHGGISVVARPILGIDNVTNSDPISFAAGDETDAELQTRENSSIETVRYSVLLGEIDVGEGVDRVFELDLESGEVKFSDGQHGARLPAGETVVATYETGGGDGGNIRTRFKLNPLDLAPFLIPLADFATDDQGKPDIRLVFSGISAIELFPTESGLLVSGIRLIAVPEPATLGLIIVGLLGLGLRHSCNDRWLFSSVCQTLRGGRA